MESKKNSLAVRIIIISLIIAVFAAVLVFGWKLFSNKFYPEASEPVSTDSNEATVTTTAIDTVASETESNAQTTAAAQPATTEPVKINKHYIVNTVSDPLNVRNQPSVTGNTPIYSLPKGTVVTLLEDNGEWFRITATVKNRTVEGWVSSQFLIPYEGEQSNDSKDEQEIETIPAPAD